MCSMWAIIVPVISVTLIGWGERDGFSGIVMTERVHCQWVMLPGTVYRMYLSRGQEDGGGSDPTHKQIPKYPTLLHNDRISSN